jgi:hypothetical protein
VDKPLFFCGQASGRFVDSWTSCAQQKKEFKKGRRKK